MIRRLLCFLAVATLSTSHAQDGTANGVVFNDLNGNGSRDADEPGLPGVQVSNQREVVATDADGKWALPHDEDTIFFVIKPRGWAAPVNEEQLPQFFYIHKPAGSPADFRYKGVEPTGPLPESIDFALSKQEEPDQFKAILFGDPQPSSIDQVDYIKHDILEELIGTDASFGVTLGDIMFDRLELYGPSNADVALVGIPWYNVIGNHDLNFDAKTDAESDETFHRYFGPNYYSFDHGPVHFLVLDDVDWGAVERNGHRSYLGGLGDEQLKFIENDLATVPDEKLVVVLMHIPMLKVGNRSKLYRLIEKRRYCISISGHEHWHAHEYIGAEDGWKGAKPHHHIINVCVSGTWWKGAKDELGIPHTTQRDGSPNGYSVINFDGTSHTLDFKAARQPADYQMSINAPSSVKASELERTQVFVNVFNGSEKSTVKMRVRGLVEWVELKKTLESDPFYVAVRDREIAADPKQKRQLSGPVASRHLWKGALPGGLKPGAHLIEIEATDAYGRPVKGKRIIRVME